MLRLRRLPLPPQNGRGIRSEGFSGGHHWPNLWRAHSCVQLCTSQKLSTLATILKHLYQYPFASSRAATILHHRKPVAVAMWGRLLTCGRLVIGLPPAVRKIPGRRLSFAAYRYPGQAGNLRPIGKRPFAKCSASSCQGDAALEETSQSWHCTRPQEKELSTRSPALLGTVSVARDAPIRDRPPLL
jgi:hypothetical protein